MSLLDRIDQRDARRVAKAIASGALETRDLASDHLSQFADQARAIAEPRIHDAADFLRNEGSAVAKALRHEGEAVARAAAHQAGRATRAAKADPLPVIVGVVGVALLASLVFGRRRT